MEAKHKRTTIDVLRETVHEIRAASFPMVPASLINEILEIEIRFQENSEQAIAEIEQIVSKSSKGHVGREQ